MPVGTRRIDEWRVPWTRRIDEWRVPWTQKRCSEAERAFVLTVPQGMPTVTAKGERALEEGHGERA